ncbi:MAG: ABC transporter ATP-binding protein [Microbacterium sp. SCN 70-200]|uniref:ABC transporter ATP-binding protein n=1 Tax=unclassified Microbacterium TaxID=2609290 RepID=UPI00086F34E7|nr:MULTISPECIES: ABC transporter ATP-binding protein [unclassified Microbacterium]MBN9216214.1 ABC transporter ATP-binding protein [Microbacterium sp.]ODT41802.1 MAG: ABC transporter ATP-binding protein [Microbacterium sp. SCN 70-200]OJV84491.1 MAG: ABC transporter ATP-binding protein [Microbacterium sp. 70-16]
MITETEALTPTTSAATDDVIVLDDLHRSYGLGERTVTAVDGVDLTVRRGEIVALLGPNGAGKTTTLDMLLGLTDPSSGSVRVFGQKAAQAAASGRIAAVLQTGGLLSDLTVRETVEVIASLHGRAALSRVPDVLARADLTQLSRRRISKCSGGEQQRVKFALALVADPDILVLDEPTAGMDVTARRHFWDVMRADADAGRTIVFATHYLEEAEQFARRTVVMHRGKIVADAPTASLRASLGARLLAATLPATGADALMATLGATEGVTELRVDAERVSLRAADSDAVASILLNAGAHDLEIAAPTLETAFTALTED